MAIQRINQAANSFVQPFAGTGTYTLSRALPAGFYRITTDTTQTFSTTTLYFQTTTGYRFGVAVRGGEGYVSIPLSVEQVVFGAGTFPLLLGMELIPTYPQIAAPTTTNASVTWGNPSTTSQTFDLAFTLPPTATGIGIYWRNGTFTDLATTTSPKTAITMPTLPTFNTAYPFMVVAKDANGVWGLGVELNPTFIYQFFTSNGTYVTPAWSTTADVLIVAGGGGGGGSYGGGGGGAGGAGGVRFLTNQATSGSIAVTVGAGGPGGAGGNPGSSGTNGSTTSFGALASSGGGAGNGANSGGAGPVGNNGGSGGGSAYGGAGGVATRATGNIGGYTPVEGYRGGASNGGSAGGGGGAGGEGANGVGGAAAGGIGVTHLGNLVGQGGNGTGGAARTVPGSGGVSGLNGGGGGLTGLVLVKANGTAP